MSGSEERPIKPKNAVKYHGPKPFQYILIKEGTCIFSCYRQGGMEVTHLILPSKKVKTPRRGH